MSNCIVLQIDGNFIQAAGSQLQQMSSFIEALQEHGEHQKHEHFTDLLPSLLLLSSSPQTPTSWSSLESTLQSDLFDPTYLQTLKSLPSKHILPLSSISTLTPFCEETQNLKNHVVENCMGRRVCGYYVNGRMLMEILHCV